MNRITNRKALTWCVILVLIVIFASRCGSSSNGDKQTEENLTITKEDEMEKDGVTNKSDELVEDETQEDKNDVSTSMNTDSENSQSTGKPSDNTNAQNPTGNTGNSSSNSGGQTTDKPSNNTSTQKPAGGSNDSQDTSKPSHTHNWVAEYKEVDNGHMEKQVVKEAWVEEVPVYETQKVKICHGCGKDIKELLRDEAAYIEHSNNHLLNGENSGWYSDTQKVQTGTEQIPHEAEYKEVWIPKIENVLTGYKCSCGATKGI